MTNQRAAVEEEVEEVEKEELEGSRKRRMEVEEEGC